MDTQVTKPFPKPKMLDELRTILLFEGDHIILGRGLEIARDFLGFEPEDGDNYCLDEPSRVDLSRFPIARSFDRGYDYAFAPANPMQIGEHEVQDLIAFMEGIPRIGGTSMAGFLHDFMNPKGLCRRVADTVFARWKLEIERLDQFTIREIALLANMTEGAVRNAISVGDLKAIKSGTATLIEGREAQSWLLGRKGFVPMPGDEDDASDIARSLRGAGSAKEFGRLLQSALTAKGIPDDELAKATGWSEADRQSWLDGDVAHHFRAAAALAALLEIGETDLAGALRRLPATPRKSGSPS